MSDSNKPAPVSSSTSSLLINSPLYSLHSSQSRSSDPLAPYHSCASHPHPGYQGSYPYYPHWCGVLRTTLFRPWVLITEAIPPSTLPPGHTSMLHIFIPTNRSRYGSFTSTDNCLSDPHFPQVIETVHADGSYIFLQLSAFGRAIDPELLKSEDTNFGFVCPSARLQSPSPLPTRPHVL